MNDLLDGYFSATGEKLLMYTSTDPKPELPHEQISSSPEPVEFKWSIFKQQTTVCPSLSRRPPNGQHSRSHTNNIGDDKILIFLADYMQAGEFSRLLLENRHSCYQTHSSPGRKQFRRNEITNAVYGTKGSPRSIFWLRQGFSLSRCSTKPIRRESICIVINC